MAWRLSCYYHITCSARDCRNELVANADDPDEAEAKADALWAEVGGAWQGTGDYLCWDCNDEDDDEDEA